MRETYCKCKKCGYEKAEVDISVVLTSYPVQYKYHCPKCGLDSYIDTDEVYDYEIATFNPHLVIDPPLYKSCLVCGELIKTSNLEVEVICDECKEAIKWAKEQQKKEGNK